MTDSPPSAPDTIASLREQHLGLMKQWRTVKSDKTRGKQAEMLRQAVYEAGVDLDSPAERDEAQGIIDYWASSIAALSTHTYPALLSLKAYEGTKGRQAGESAQRVYESLADETDKRLARQLFQQLLREGPKGLERTPPCPRATLLSRAGHDQEQSFNTVLKAFEASGAIRRLPGDDPQNDRFEASSTAIAGAWPELKGWLADNAAYYRGLSDIESLAKRWQKAGQDPDLLLKGAKLEDADRFEGESALLQKYILESKKSRETFVLQRRAVIGGLFTLACALALYFILLNNKLTHDVDDYRKKNEELAAKIQTYEQKIEIVTQDEKLAERPALEPIDVAATAGDALPALQSKTAAAEGLTRLDELQGAMWLGSDERPQVLAVDGKRQGPPDFAHAAAGTRYRVRAAIYLRNDMPVSEANYTSPKEKAVIPAGSLVILESPTRGFKRETGIQYWAKIRVVPRVYIQFAGTDRAQVNILRQQLMQAGFDVPQAERIGEAADFSEVRYFNKQDRNTATHLLNTLHGIDGFSNVTCRSMTKSALSDGNFILELWVGPRRMGRAAKETGAACP